MEFIYYSLDFLKVHQHFNLTLGYAKKLQIHFFKKLFFIIKMTESACLFLFALNTKHVKVTRSDKKLQHLYGFCGIFEKCLALLMANCKENVLFVMIKEFQKWLNTNEKIFSDPHMKNSICSFRG